MFASVGVSSYFSWLPVDPIRVTELKLDGDGGPLNEEFSIYK